MEGKEKAFQHKLNGIKYKEHVWWGDLIHRRLDIKPETHDNNFAKEWFNSGLPGRIMEAELVLLTNNPGQVHDSRDVADHVHEREDNDSCGGVLVFIRAPPGVVNEVKISS